MKLSTSISSFPSRKSYRETVMPYAEPRTAITSNSSPFSSSEDKASSSAPAIPFKAAFHAFQAFEQHGSKSVVSDSPSDDDDHGWTIVFKSKRGKMLPTQLTVSFAPVDASKSLDPTVDPFIPDHLKAAAVEHRPSSSKINQVANHADPEDDPVPHLRDDLEHYAAAMAFLMSDSRPVKAPVAKDSYAAAPTPVVRVDEHKPTSRPIDRAVTRARDFSDPPRARPPTRIGRCLPRQSAKSKDKGRAADLFGSRASRFRVVKTYTHDGTRRVYRTRDLPPVHAKRRAVLDELLIAARTKKEKLAQKVKKSIHATTYHRGLSAEGSWREHKRRYCEPGISTKPVPVTKPFTLYQSEKFQHVLQDALNNTTDPYFQSQIRCPIHGIGAVETEVADIVMSRDPIETDHSPLSSLLQGLVRKGLKNGTIKPETIVKLWMQGGNSPESAPIPFEMIAQERAKRSGDRTHRVQHSSRPGWGRSRPRLRNARYRGQSNAAPPSRPTISNRTKEAFRRLVVDSTIQQERVPSHHRHYCNMASVGGVEEQKDGFDEETEPSVHDDDSDYVPDESAQGDDDLLAVLADTPIPPPIDDDDTDDGIEDVTPPSAPQSPNLVRTAINSLIKNLIQTPSLRRLAPPGILPALTNIAAASTTPPFRSAANNPAAAAPTVPSSPPLIIPSTTAPPTPRVTFVAAPPTPSPSRNVQGGAQKQGVRLVKLQVPSQRYDAHVIDTLKTYFRVAHRSDIPASMSIADQLEIYNELGPNFISQFRRYEREVADQAAATEAARRSFDDDIAATAAASAAAADAAAIKKRTKKRREHDDDDDFTDASSASADRELTFDTCDYYEPDHGTWFDYRKRRLLTARGRLSPSEKQKDEVKVSKLYDKLHKKAHHQTLPILKHTADQSRRATEYRRWIAQVHNVLLHNMFSRKLLDSVTYEVDRDAALPLYALEGVALFLIAKVAERMRFQFQTIDRSDPLSVLYRLQQYCIPSSPMIRNNLSTELQSFKILPTETATVYLQRFQLRVEHAYAQDVRFTETQQVDILLEGFGVCRGELHSRYNAQVAQFRQQRGVEDRATQPSPNPLTIGQIEYMFDTIDGMYSHRSSKQGGEPARNRDRYRTHDRDRRPRQHANEVHETPPDHHANEVKTPRVATTQRPPIKCFKCGGPHSISACDKIKDPAEKQKYWEKFRAEQEKRATANYADNLPPPRANRGGKHKGKGPKKDQEPKANTITPIKQRAQFCSHSDNEQNHHANAVWQAQGVDSMSENGEDSVEEIITAQIPTDTEFARDPIVAAMPTFPVSLFSPFALPFEHERNVEVQERLFLRWTLRRNLLLIQYGEPDYDLYQTLPDDYDRNFPWYEDDLIPTHLQELRMACWRDARANELNASTEANASELLWDTSSDEDSMASMPPLVQRNRPLPVLRPVSGPPAILDAHSDNDTISIPSRVGENLMEDLFGEDSSDPEMPPLIPRRSPRIASRLLPTSYSTAFDSDSDSDDNPMPSRGRGRKLGDSSSESETNQELSGLFDDSSDDEFDSQPTSFFYNGRNCPANVPIVPQPPLRPTKTWPNSILRRREPAGRAVTRTRSNQAFATKSRSNLSFAGIPPVHHGRLLGEDYTNYWLPDSGTSAHMTPYVADIIPGTLRPHKSFVTVANNTCVRATHIGTVALHLTNYMDPSVTRVLEIHEVLVVPDLATRLLSTDQLNKYGHDVLFSANSVDFVIMETTRERLVLKIPKRFIPTRDGKSLKWPDDAFATARLGDPTPFLIGPAYDLPNVVWNVQPDSTSVNNSNNTTVAMYSPDSPASPAPADPPIQDAHVLEPRSDTNGNETFAVKPGKRQIGCGLMHNRMGHRSVGALMLAQKDDLWGDATLKPEPDAICETCRITLSRKANRGKQRPPRAVESGHTILLDIEKNPFHKGLTSSTHFKYFLIVVDQASTFTVLLGTNRITSAEVIRLLKIYCAMFRSQYSNVGPVNADFNNLRLIQADAGTQFDSDEFRSECMLNAGIFVYLAAPKHQETNGLCERTWQSVRNLAFSFMNHARVGEEFGGLALEHAWKVFNVLPIKGLVDSNGLATTPYQLFYGIKPSVRKMRVLFCPVVAKVHERQQTDPKTRVVRRYNSRNHPQ